MVLEKMLVLFTMMFIGYIAFKKKMITEEVSTKLSGIIVNIANPALILSSVASDDIYKISSKDLVETSILSVIVYAALLVLAEIIIRIVPIQRENYGMYRVMLVFSNIGYMGYPIIKSIYGAGALVYASVFLIPFNVLIYTYGILVMKQGNKNAGKFQFRTLFNNGVIACIFMLLILIFKIRLPQIVNDVISGVAGMVVPISMMIIGASLATIKFKEIVTNINLIFFSVIRSLVIPIAGFFILVQFVENDVLLGVTLVMLATPIGSLTAMLAKEYGGDFRLASKGIALTTIASVVTLPVVFAVTGA